VLYKHINSAALQAAEDPRGQADFVFASLGVFGRTFPRSKLLRKAQPYPPGSVKAGPHLGSWRKRCLISHEKVQNAEN